MITSVASWTPLTQDLLSVSGSYDQSIPSPLISCTAICCTAFGNATNQSPQVVTYSYSVAVDPQKNGTWTATFGPVPSGLYTFVASIFEQGETLPDQQYTVVGVDFTLK